MHKIADAYEESEGSVMVFVNSGIPWRFKDRTEFLDEFEDRFEIEAMELHWLPKDEFGLPFEIHGRCISECSSCR